MEYIKKEAIQKSKDFLKELKKLEKKYSLTLNSDSGDIYLSFKNIDESKWDSVKIGWKGDNSGIQVMEKTDEDKRKEILEKLTEKEKKLLGLI
jgi:hypothetical protein